MNRYRQIETTRSWLHPDSSFPLTYAEKEAYYYRVKLLESRVGMIFLQAEFKALNVVPGKATYVVLKRLELLLFWSSEPLADFGDISDGACPGITSSRIA